jgi:hypothetical protein
MPLTNAAKSFLEQLEREHGATLAYICCRCEDNRELDSNVLILFNRECPVHGRSWHRLMVRQPDGSLKLALPLDKQRP